MKASVIIPPILDPMGAGWRQPDANSITIEGNVAFMSQADFNLLYDYSSTIPTGVYPGKMWRALASDGWHLRWMGECEDPSKVTLCELYLCIGSPEPQLTIGKND